MGWLTYYRPPGETDKDHFQKELLGPNRRIVECATKDNVFYAAVENLTDGYTPKGTVWALVCLISRSKDSYGHNFGYKDMDETMGPVAVGCPDRVLMPTPVRELYGDPVDGASYDTASNAIQWRSEARIANAKAKKLPKVKKGDTVKVSKPWTFGSGRTEDTFTLVDGKRNFWKRAKDGMIVRLPARRNWPSYEVIA